MDGFKNLLISFISSMLGTFDTAINGVSVILGADIFSGDMYNMSVTVANTVKPIALTIVTICFLVEFLKKTIKMDILKWEYGLTVFFKLVFAKGCIDLASPLLSAIYATVAEWLSKLSHKSTFGATQKILIEQSLKGMDFWGVLGVAMSCMLVFLAVWVLSIIMNVMAYARKIELLVYLSVSPIPFAFLPLEDGNSSRIPRKYVLNFASVSLQGLFMIISCKLFTSIVTEFTSTTGANAMDLSYNLLLGVMILAVAIFKSGSWAKSVLDVG